MKTAAKSKKHVRHWKTTLPLRINLLSGLICLVAVLFSVLRMGHAAGTAAVSVEGRTNVKVSKTRYSSFGSTIDLTITCDIGTLYVVGIPKRSGSYNLGIVSRSGNNPRAKAWMSINGEGDFEAWENHNDKYGDGNGTGTITLTINTNDTVSGSLSFTGYRKDTTKQISANFTKVDTGFGTGG